LDPGTFPAGPTYVLPIVIGDHDVNLQKMTPMAPGADPIELMMMMPVVFTSCF
jgi:hypothetical protein